MSNSANENPRAERLGYTDSCLPDTQGDEDACCECSKMGARCDDEHVTLEALEVDKGYYRLGPKSAQVVPCEHKFACVGGGFADVSVDLLRSDDPVEVANLLWYVSFVICGWYVSFFKCYKMRVVGGWVKGYE